MKIFEGENTTLAALSNGNQSLTLKGKVDSEEQLILVDGSSTLGFLN